VKALRLREWREAQGQTQTELGERAGVAGHTISRIESGASLHPSTARKLAGALGVEVVDLMKNPPALVGNFPKAEAPEAASPAGLEEGSIFAIEYDSHESRDEAWKRAVDEARSFYEGPVSIRDTGERIEVYAGQGAIKRTSSEASKTKASSR
jgi:transcriptional regulator with XRE-family HTH domain